MDSFYGPILCNKLPIFLQGKFFIGSVWTVISACLSQCSYFLPENSRTSIQRNTTKTRRPQWLSTDQWRNIWRIGPSRNKNQNKRQNIFLQNCWPPHFVLHGPNIWQEIKQIVFSQTISVHNWQLAKFKREGSSALRSRVDHRKPGHQKVFGSFWDIRASKFHIRSQHKLYTSTMTLFTQIVHSWRAHTVKKNNTTFREIQSPVSVINVHLFKERKKVKMVFLVLLSSLWLWSVSRPEKNATKEMQLPSNWPLASFLCCSVKLSFAFAFCVACPWNPSRLIIPSLASCLRHRCWCNRTSRQRHFPCWESKNVLILTGSKFLESCFPRWKKPESTLTSWIQLDPASHRPHTTCRTSEAGPGCSLLWRRCACSCSRHT